MHALWRLRWPSLVRIFRSHSPGASAKGARPPQGGFCISRGPPPVRTVVYVDGFNLYYGALKGTPYRWLDLERLCRLLLPSNDVQRINYHTAPVAPRPDDPKQPVRQQIYLRASQCPEMLGTGTVPSGSRRGGSSAGTGEAGPASDGAVSRLVPKRNAESDATTRGNPAPERSRRNALPLRARRDRAHEHADGGSEGSHAERGRTGCTRARRPALIP
jgi:hypothetical protein